MTRENAKKMLHIITAFAEGKEIECFAIGIGWIPFTTENPTFGYEFIDPLKYRIKPEPKLVPFTFEDRELFRGKWIRRKADGCEFCPNEIYLRSVYYQANNCVKYSDLLSKFEFLDGSPCGKYINE